MGKRTATAILEARGAFKKNPQRRRERAGEPQGVGAFPSEPPDHLTEDQREMWREVVALVPPGVLTGSDTLSVELVAVMYARFREVQHGMSAGAMTRMQTEMGRLGLNPADRTRLSTTASHDSEEDGFK